MFGKVCFTMAMLAGMTGCAPDASIDTANGADEKSVEFGDASATITCSDGTTVTLTCSPKDGDVKFGEINGRKHIFCDKNGDGKAGVGEDWVRCPE